jgi:hypothetical protein
MDQLDEACNVTLLRLAKYQQALQRYHGRQAWGWVFNVDDLVLWLIQSNKDYHKLSPPFIIAQVLWPGSYKLQTPDDEVFTNAWNIE